MTLVSRTRADAVPHIRVGDQVGNAVYDHFAEPAPVQVFAVALTVVEADLVTSCVSVVVQDVLVTPPGPASPVTARAADAINAASAASPQPSYLNRKFAVCVVPSFSSKIS